MLAIQSLIAFLGGKIYSYGQVRDLLSRISINSLVVQLKMNIEKKRRIFGKQNESDLKDEASTYPKKILSTVPLEYRLENRNLFRDRSLDINTLNIKDDPKKRTHITPFKVNPLTPMDTKLHGMVWKIKSIVHDMSEKLDSKIEEQERVKGDGCQDSERENKNTLKLSKCTGELMKSSAFLSRMQVEKPPAPYFVQCLRRKSAVLTEAKMHIHASICTFKQFLRSAQLAKVKPVDPKIPPETERKTIVFDMDETLIHTSDIMTPGFEIKVPFRTFQGRVVSGFVNVRPYAKDIIKNLSKFFDVIVFTAGNQCYADPILDHIDPTHCLTHRLYRQSCTFVNNQLFMKDLRILGRKLENVVLIDNAPHSYLMQLNNGIPILNYLKGKDDNQLVLLQPYLMSLLDVADVRVINQRTFRLQQYVRYDNPDRLIAALYGKFV